MLEQPSQAPPAPVQPMSLAGIQESDDKQCSENETAAELLRRLPALDEAFSLHGKIGEGTFSSVWLGCLKREQHVSEDKRRRFAIKHLVPTTHPSRIEHELRCLRELGGRDNIIGVDLCLRSMDTVVFVMPYIPHTKFSEYVLDMDAEETRGYMRALLLALCRVHRHGVIHRDIKPSNFLYDRPNRRYLLVDFGLAQRVAHITQKYGVEATVISRKRTASQAEVGSPPRAKRVVATAPLHHLQVDHPKLAQHKPLPPPQLVCRTACVPPTKACVCWGRGAVCGACRGRVAGRAPRAGTQGFRPPEVLLQYKYQTTAVDVWACGVTLLSILSGRYPFFRATDDVSALAEFSSLFGTAALQQVAANLGQQLLCSEPRRALCLRRLCERLRTRALDPTPVYVNTITMCCVHCHLRRDECVCKLQRVPTPHASWCGFPDSAFDLLHRLLTLDPRARITAAAALRHPFLNSAVQ